MAIRTVVTRGFGNGTFNGTIPLVTLRGYIGGEAIIVEPEEANSGGFWFDYDRHTVKRTKKKKKVTKIDLIQDEIDRQLAIEFAKQEAQQARIDDLNRLTILAENHQAEINKSFSPNVIKATNRAIEKRTYSAMEALERELRLLKEEEDFLLMAANILFNQ